MLNRAFYFSHLTSHITGWYPMQETVPIAVSSAVAIDAMICIIHLMVSFFITHLLPR